VTLDESMMGLVCCDRWTGVSSFPLLLLLRFGCLFLPCYYYIFFLKFLLLLSFSFSSFLFFSLPFSFIHSSRFLGEDLYLIK
jgi:hypothetical protein